MVVALGVAACGGSGRSEAGRGGTLTVLPAGDVDHLDPGSAYYQLSYMVVYATQRPLYSFRPEATSVSSPDLADGPPRIGRDGRRVTVCLKRGIRFGPPVNREVTADDVRYALERGLLPSVRNGTRPPTSPP